MSFHILGDRDTILGFRFAGVTGSAVETQAEAQAAFRRAVAGGQYQILILTQKVAQLLDAEATAHRLAARPPYLVEVPDIWGTRVPRKSLERMIQEAVGIRIGREDDEAAAPGRDGEERGRP
jgi:V/A-type H+-transporting ATPase subunit F